MGWGCNAEVGAPPGLGKCNSSSQPGAGVEEEARGRGPPGSAVESVGLGRTAVQICGSDERGQRRPPRPGIGRGRGLTCVVPRPPPACPLAIPSKAPEISVFSACGSVVWRKVAPRPRAPAPPPPRPPPPAPSPSPPPACAPCRPPSRTGRAAAHPSPEQTWSSWRALWEETWGDREWREHPILGPGVQELARASGSLRAGGKAGRLWRVVLGCKERTCRSVWRKDCSVAGGGGRLRRLPAVLGTRAGRGPREGSLDLDAWDLPLRWQTIPGIVIATSLAAKSENSILL